MLTENAVHCVLLLPDAEGARKLDFHAQPSGLTQYKIYEN